MSDAHRVKIQNSNILNALLEHIEGKRDMSATQVSAGINLLKKVLPDLSSVEIEGEVSAALTVQIIRLADADDSTPR